MAHAESSPPAPALPLSIPERFRAELLAQVPMGVTVWRLLEPGDLTTWAVVATNPMGAELTQQPPEGLAGKRLLDLVPEPDADGLVDGFRRVHLHRQPVDLGDVRYALASGREVWLRARLVPLSGGHVASLYTDVTERVEAVVALAARTEALERSNRELEEFAAVVSHDLREPLRKVTAFGDRLSRRADLDARGADYLRRMVGAAERMQQLIDDLLTYGRVRAEAQALESLALSVVVRDVLSDLEVAVDEAGARVDVGALPQVHGDRTQLRQLFQNLIGNALKFRREGVAPEISLQVDASAPPGFVRTVVTDNGIGFEPRFASQIFGVFQRLHGRAVFEGSGMGLAVCKRIVERHGGRIVAEGRLGEGATFWVDLPAAPVDHEASS